MMTSYKRQKLVKRKKENRKRRLKVKEDYLFSPVLFSFPVRTAYPKFKWPVESTLLNLSEYALYLKCLIRKDLDVILESLERCDSLVKATNKN